MTTRTFFNPNSATLANVRHEVERMFDNVFSANSGSRIYPAVNVLEDEDTFRVEAELPGIVLEDLSVTVADGELTLSGRRTKVNPPEATALRRERGTLEFERSLTLPSSCETDGIEAVMRNGVLTVSVPKSERARTRQIEVTRA